MFMQKVATLNNIPLQESTSDSGLDLYKWKTVTTYDGAWTGKIIVQLTSERELHQMRQSIHGQGIEIQHHLAGIYVDSAHVDLRPNAGRESTQSS